MRRLGGLWRQPDFVRLWAGQTVSAFGSHITAQALPLTAVLVLAATPAQLGWLTAVAAAPVLAFGLLVGVWVDRRRRRPIMIVTDLGRAGLLASIPFAALFDGLTMFQLYLVAALTGLLTLLFNVADQSYLPSLVEPALLVEGNSKLSASSSLAEVGGPALGGVLVQIITAPFAIAFDAVSFVISALCIGSIRKAEARPVPTEPRQHIGREALEGLRVIFTNVTLKAITLNAVQRSFFGNIIGTLYMVFIIRELGMPVWIVGVLTGLGGLSALLGAVIAGWVSDRLGIGPSLIGASLLTASLTFLIPLATGPLWIVVVFLIVSQLSDVGWTIFFIGETSLRQALTPPLQRGRITASTHFLTGGVGLVGAILGGLLADLIGIRALLLVGATGQLAAVLWLIRSPVAHIKQLDV